MAAPQVVPLNLPLQPIRAANSRNRPLLKLNSRQRKFVDAYMEHGNATKAAAAAGYPESQAAKSGSRLIRNPTIHAAIEAKLEASGLSATYVLESLKGIADGEKTRNSDRIAALTLLGKHLKLFTDTMEVSITHDLADRVAQARARVTSGKRRLPAAPAPNESDAAQPVDS